MKNLTRIHYPRDARSYWNATLCGITIGTDYLARPGEKATCRRCLKAWARRHAAGC